VFGVAVQIEDARANVANRATKEVVTFMLERRFDEKSVVGASDV